MRISLLYNLLYRIIVLLAVCSITTEGIAQPDTFRLINTLSYPITSFTVDNLGELYLINSSNQLKKLDEKGDSIGVFNQVTKYGKLSYVEAQNPWKTILYYQNFSTIVLLDKYLQSIGTINL